MKEECLVYSYSRCSQVDHMCGCLSDTEDQVELYLDKAVEAVSTDDIIQTCVKAIEVLDVTFIPSLPLVEKVLAQNPKPLIGQILAQTNKGDMEYEWNDLFEHVLSLQSSSDENTPTQDY